MRKRIKNLKFFMIKKLLPVDTNVYCQSGKIFRITFRAIAFDFYSKHIGSKPDMLKEEIEIEMRHRFSNLE